MADKTSTHSAGQDYVVIESGKTSLKDLYTKEDWMAIWMGFIILIVGLFIYLSNPPDKMQENFNKYNATMKEEAAKAPFKTIAWHQASDSKSRIRARDQSFGKTIQEFLNAPSKWTANPVDALYRSKAEADALNAPFKEAAEKAKAAQEAALAKAKEAEKAAGAAAFKNADLNKKAEAEVAAWLKAKDAASKANALRPVLHGLLFRLRSRCARLHGGAAVHHESLWLRISSLGHHLRYPDQ